MLSGGEVKGEWEDFVRSRLGRRYTGDAWDVAADGRRTWIFIAYRGRNRRDEVFRSQINFRGVSRDIPEEERVREMDSQNDEALGQAEGNLTGWTAARKMLYEKVHHHPMRE